MSAHKQGDPALRSHNRQERGASSIEMIAIVGLFAFVVAGGVRTLACAGNRTAGGQAMSIAGLQHAGSDTFGANAAQEETHFSVALRQTLSDSNLSAQEVLALREQEGTASVQSGTAGLDGIPTQKGTFLTQGYGAATFQRGGPALAKSSANSQGIVDANFDGIPDDPVSVQLRVANKKDPNAPSLAELIEEYEQGDEDGDGVPNIDDPDHFLNNPTTLPGNPNTEGLPSWDDPDSWEPNVPEEGDNPNDPNGDNVEDFRDPRGDEDGDGIENYWDPDSPIFHDFDLDGIPDAVDTDSPHYTDSDGDGVLDKDDPDFDYDAARLDEVVSNFNDQWADDDGDGIPNRSDSDSSFSWDLDQDGIPDAIDPNTHPDSGSDPNDQDDNGIPDLLDAPFEPEPFNGRDVDGDGIPDSLDPEPYTPFVDSDAPEVPQLGSDWANDIGDTYTPQEREDLKDEIRNDLEDVFTEEDWDDFRASGSEDAMKDFLDEQAEELTKEALEGKNPAPPPQSSGSGDGDGDGDGPELETNNESNNSGWGNRPGGEFGSTTTPHSYDWASLS